MILPVHVCPEEPRKIILKHIYHIIVISPLGVSYQYLALYKDKNKKYNQDFYHNFEILATYGREYRDHPSVPFTIYCGKGIVPIKIKEVPIKELPLYLNWNLTSNFTKILKKIKQKDIA